MRLTCLSVSPHSRGAHSLSRAVQAEFFSGCEVLYKTSRFRHTDAARTTEPQVAPVRTLASRYSLSREVVLMGQFVMQIGLGMFLLGLLRFAVATGDPGLPTAIAAWLEP